MKFVFDLAKLDQLSPGQRARALELLQQFSERRRVNPLEAYAPMPPQHEFHLAQARLRAFFGGNRAGKTTCGIVDDLIQASPEDLLPDHLKAYKKYHCPFYVRVVCPDYTNFLIPVILQKLRDWTPLPLLRDQNFDRAYDKANKSLRLECGCRFDFMTYQQELQQFGGAALHRVHYDEEPPQDIRNECKARLLDFGGDEILTMTPLDGMTPWAYDEVWMRRDEDGVFCIQADMTDNVHLNKEAVEEFLASLSPEERDARAKGVFVHFGGMVYPEYGRGACAPFDRKFVQALDQVVAIDPGIRTTGVSFTGFDGENRAFKWAELKLNDAIVPEVVAEIRKVLEVWGVDWDMVHFVIDPAAAQRSQATGIKLETEYQVAGLYPAHANNDVETGVAMIRRRLRQGGYFWSKACTEGEWEAKRYRIKTTNSDGSKTTKFEVIKEHDHVMDADRYAIMERPWYEEMPLPELRPREDVAFPPPRRNLERVGVEGQFA